MGIKENILQTIEEKKPVFIEASHQISAKPELQNEEFFAAELLATLLEKEGFALTRGIRGHETAFIAKKGQGAPHVVFMAEYDALPEIGHGCGHNIIGALSALSATAIAKEIKKGTVYVYGTPAEEGGNNGSAKASFVNQGYFDGIDAAMMIHPGSKNQTSTKGLAVHCYDFEFFGKTAHAAGCPEDGVNALDAMILFFNGISALRQQTTTETRIHGIITRGGTAPNVIPGYTKAKFFVRANTIEHCDYVLGQVQNIAKGAATMTGCTTQNAPFNNTVADMLQTPMLDELYYEKAKELGLTYTFAKGDGKGSSDVGNVSQVVPTIQPGIAVTEKPIPGHTVEFRDACIASLADEALAKGAAILALTALELFENPQALQRIKADHQRAKAEKGEQ